MRPFVKRLADRHELAGFVRNLPGDVRIEVEGAEAAIARFAEDLRRELPTAARVDRWESGAVAPSGERGFWIQPSADDAGTSITIAPDLATCDECFRELFDPSDRRYRYPFINCTQCGPRLTIIRDVPYDRERTTMARFAMCRDCRREYEDPNDRRFHAQPIACPACGPRLLLVGPDGMPIERDDPLSEFARRIRQGQIGALKGLGGFHLVCNAGDSNAVRELRRRKHREQKPLAIMVRNIEFARRLCRMSKAESSVLRSPESPIVLLDRLAERAATVVCDEIALGHRQLGLMLPYTPVHHLLIDALADRALVMTSGNRTDEPIAYENESTLKQLNGIADVFLLHDRPIHTRCDDSVVRVQQDQVDKHSVQILRRARGYAPDGIPAPLQAPVPILAVGGQLKSTFCLLSGGEAILSHHLGDLDELTAYEAFEESIAHYEALHRFKPCVIAHDAHPEYASTRYAIARAEASGLLCVGVQHHEAHIAACMADNGVTRPVIGVAFDGTGYGIDDRLQQPTVWGGEFLIGDLRGFRRAARLRYVRMPGGEAAIRQPWRMAYAWLRSAGYESTVGQELLGLECAANLDRLVSTGLNSAWTSSMGRLFDAVSALLGICTVASYEGQAACELEQWETANGDLAPYDFQLCETESYREEECSAFIEIDCRPAIRHIVESLRRGVDRSEISSRFHATIARIILDTCERIRSQTGLNIVALSGGVFANRVLLARTLRLLRARDFDALTHRRVPPNDGGISLGQALIAAARIRLGNQAAQTHLPVE